MALKRMIGNWRRKKSVMNPAGMFAKPEATCCAVNIPPTAISDNDKAARMSGIRIRNEP